LKYVCDIVVKKGSRPLSHLLMSFLSFYATAAFRRRPTCEAEVDFIHTSFNSFRTIAQPLLKLLNFLISLRPMTQVYDLFAIA